MIEPKNFGMLETTNSLVAPSVDPKTTTIKPQEKAAKQQFESDSSETLSDTASSVEMNEFGCSKMLEVLSLS